MKNLEKEIKEVNLLYLCAEAPMDSTPLSILAASSVNEDEVKKKNVLYAYAQAPGNSTPKAMIAAAADSEKTVDQINRLYLLADAPGDSVPKALLAAGAAFQYRLQTELRRRYPSAKTVADVPAKEYQALRDQYNVLRVFGIYQRRKAA